MQRPRVASLSMRAWVEGVGARWFVRVALFVTAICAFVPFMPAMPAAQLDEAWGLGINQAVAQGLVFGRDVIFSSGPYASIFNQQYHPATDALMLLGSAYLALAWWLAALEISRTSRWYVPWLLWTVLAGVIASRDALILSYPLLAGLACCRRPARTWVVVALCSPLGLLPLIKGSFGVLAALVGGIVIVQLVLERRYRLAAGVAGIAVATMLGSWCLAGQPVLALPRYLWAQLPIITGYAEAMGYEAGSWAEVPLYLIAAALLVWRGERGWPRAVYAAFLLVSFKAGFVRHDSHAQIAGVGILVAALVAPLRPIVTAAALAAWLYIRGQYVHVEADGFVAWTKVTYGHAAGGVHRRIAEPGWPRSQFDAVLALVREGSHLPALPGTMDDYSTDQTLVIASGNRWNPRPVLQSYSAYTGELARLDRAHLEGPDAPDSVLFAVQPLDQRLPSLEDGASWPALLARYEPVSRIGDRLLLRRRATPATVEVTTLATRTASLGERVEVPAADGLVFAEIDVEPDLLGRIESLLLRPTVPTIVVWVPGSKLRYRYIPEMGRAGFLLSPLVTTTDDFVALYGPHPASVVAFEIYHGNRRWTSTYTVTLKQLRIR